jgi:hypothetical protein
MIFNVNSEFILPTSGQVYQVLEVQGEQMLVKEILIKPEGTPRWVSINSAEAKGAKLTSPEVRANAIAEILTLAADMPKATLAEAVAELEALGDDFIK